METAWRGKRACFMENLSQTKELKLGGVFFQEKQHRPVDAIFQRFSRPGSL